QRNVSALRTRRSGRQAAPAVPARGATPLARTHRAAGETDCRVEGKARGGVESHVEREAGDGRERESWGAPVRPRGGCRTKPAGKTDAALEERGFGPVGVL